MRNLECDPSTLVGPIDERVVADIDRRYPLPADFLAYMKACHGGRPKVGAFKVGSKTGHIELFLTLLDQESDLPPPFRPHFGVSSWDERALNSIRYLLDYEHATHRALFGKLLPFAALLAGMHLDCCYVDLLCLDYRENRSKPPVVLWVAAQANTALMNWEDLPIEEQFDAEENIKSVPWDDFLIPLAPDFAAFIEMLRPVTE